MKNHYEIRGTITAVFLRRKDGTVLETIIDTNDLKIAKSLPNSWCAWYNRHTKTYYVVGTLPGTKQKTKKVYMHRFLMSTPPNLQVDHINNDTLDNRRSSNLRNVTPTINQHNKKVKGRGVSFDTKYGKWEAYLHFNGRKKHLGYHSSDKEAEKAVAVERERLGVA